MKMKQLYIGVLLLILGSSVCTGQQYQLLQSLTTSGGGTASSVSYTNITTIGQTFAGQDSSSSYHQGSGFWSEYQGLKNYLGCTYSFARGWNMISIPESVADYRKIILYPGAASEAFAYVRGYHTKDTLTRGLGYWLKFGTARDIRVVGVSIQTDTVPVANGWNMIGSVGNPVDTANIASVGTVTVASTYFGYNHGYYAADTIRPGKAYWVKTRGGGQLILGPTSVVSASAKPAHSETDLGKLNTISFKSPSVDGDKAKELTFYFGVDKKTDVDRYELPPVPPPGVFDARFGTNRYVEVINEQQSGPVQIPLLIQTDEKQVTMSYEIKDQARTKYSIVEKQGTKELSRHKLSQKGELTLDGLGEKSYSLRMEQIPSAYALYQNYPNPFNPTTTIRFDLPVRSQVTLKIYNILGQEVRTLLNNEVVDEGQQSAEWHAYEGGIASGTYFYRIQSTSVADGRSYTNVKKMLLLK